MNICSRCGTDNNYNAQFCRGCGVALEGNQATATIPYKKHNALLIGLGIGVGIVVLLVIGLLFFLPPQNPLVGKWVLTDDSGYEQGATITVAADGTIKFGDEIVDELEGYKLTYKTHDDVILGYTNGKFAGLATFAINGNTITIKYCDQTYILEKVV